MKIPEQPPKTESLLTDEREALKRLLGRLEGGELAIPEAYPHWDNLSSYSLPPFLDLREWWLVLKLQRLVGRQPLALTDRDSRPFNLGSVEFFAQSLHEFDWQRSAGARQSPASADYSVHEDLSVSALREEAIASAQLDGAEVEIADARELLRLQRKPRSPGERMVLNVHRTLERVREICRPPLTLAGLAELHQRLTAGTLARPDLSGRLRWEGDPARNESLENQLLRAPPPAVELPARLKAMLAFANGRAPARFVHPVLRAMALHFWIVYDRPFADGNGRLARALFFWGLLHAGYGQFDFLAPSAALRDAPAQYLRAFHCVETDDNDLMYFAAHLFDAIARAQRRLREEIKLKESATREAAGLTATLHDLNARQRAVIAEALKNPAWRCLLQEHARKHRLVRQTARNDLTPLVRRGWFEEAKVGKALAFFPVAGLAEKLK